jgi:aspartyl-tRNA(Asn)/glutamyl-tRNA(Gln) amidotransferase subunit B
MELVTEPVMHDAKTAGDFARELQLLLRTLGVSDANMEKGEMRVEANISISSTDTFGTKVEVKNLNSFRSVEGAIEYEIKRQAEVLERGDSVVQETRGWDEAKLKTFSQRVKESAHDYRYFPDPDLPSMHIEDSLVSRLNEIMPQLPKEKRLKYGDVGLTSNQIETIIGDKRLDNFFSETLKEAGEGQEELAQIAANYIVTDLVPLIGTVMDTGTLNPGPFVGLMRLVVDKKITSRIAKDLLGEVVFSGLDPQEAVIERGLLQNDSADALARIVTDVIAQNPTVAADFKAGKQAALQFLVGQGMKLSKGTANPTLLAELLTKNLL